MKLFLKHACDPVCVFRAIKVALVIGTIHALLNHFDAIMDGTLTLTNVLQMLLTYCIPYSVATHGSAMQARHMELHSCTGRNGSGTIEESARTSKTIPGTIENEPGTTNGAAQSSSGIRESACPDTLAERVRIDLRLFVKYVRDPVCFRRAIKMALVVGTIIGIINHIDEILDGTIDTTNYVQIGLTYVVPFCVSTYGSVRQASHIELQGKEDTDSTMV